MRFILLFVFCMGVWGATDLHAQNLSSSKINSMMQERNKLVEKHKSTRDIDRTLYQNGVLVPAVVYQKNADQQVTIRFNLFTLGEAGATRQMWEEKILNGFRFYGMTEGRIDAETGDITATFPAMDAEKMSKLLIMAGYQKTGAILYELK